MRKRREDEIRSIIESHFGVFSKRFLSKHINELKEPLGVLNLKRHNVLLQGMGEDFLFYSSLSRSWDSSFGTHLEVVAREIASANFDVIPKSTSYVYARQDRFMAELIAKYRDKAFKRQPLVSDYIKLRELTVGRKLPRKLSSDFILKNIKTKRYTLIELKSGGNLDNKKAETEKSALLRHLCCLSNMSPSRIKIDIRFATAYNHLGEDEEWSQGRVNQFFARSELLIGREFWNFVGEDMGTYPIVKDEYQKLTKLLRPRLEKLKADFKSSRKRPKHSF